jgi:uncharacterized protein (TIGR01244 family)
VVAPNVASAGQPTTEALERLKASGFGTVITLRNASESPAVAEEEAIVKKQGLKYVSVPVSPQTFSAADVDAVRRAIEEADGPVLLHCASGNRSGAAWAAVEHARGASREEALAAGQKGGLKPGPMTDALSRVWDEKQPASK